MPQGASWVQIHTATIKICGALRTLYGKPSPVEKQANTTAFAAQWSPADPIETYFDHLDDCYVTAIIAMPPYTLEQMMDMAIMTLQITGLYQQALTEWERMLPAQHTWDNLKTRFADAYNTKLIAGTTTTGQHGFASNIVDIDDALNNIELSLNHKLSNLQVANNSNHQSMQQMMSSCTQQLATVAQQLALLATAPPTTPNATPTGTYARNNCNNWGGS